MYRIIFIILFSLTSIAAAAQRITPEQYIEQFKDIAISEMKRSGVPASITLAQGILESESGNSDLVKRSNNHFGIKCKSTWTGGSVTHDDDENGECFRAYDNALESFRDHSDFLKTNKRYSALFNLDPADYAGWARGLKKAGYATNPRYPELLVKNIEQYNLQQYSLIALNRPLDTAVAQTETAMPVLQAETAAETPGSEAEKNTLANDLQKTGVLNKTKYVTATKGTSLLAIANRYNISLSKLMDHNDITKDGLLEKDQMIFLQKKSKTGEEEYYIVEPGETLLDVAQKNAIQLKYLMQYNHLETGAVLKAKTKLFLRPRSENANKGTGKPKIHLVAPKEGLYTIARTYQVTVEELKSWNKLESDKLQVGQEIIVSK